MGNITVELPLVAIISLMLGGLGLFLFGCTFLSSNLKTLVDGGDTFRRLISKATSNRVKSCALGTGFTALIQSSGGTSALSIGLVKAGALDYEGAIAIIIGANVGTCVTSFLIAIPGISQFMPFISFAAALVMMVVHNRKAQLWSKLAFAFSLIFFGIWLIEMNVKAGIKGQEWFNNLMIFMNNNPWVGLIFATGVTLALQSSSAVIGVVQGIYAVAAVTSGIDISLFGILPLVLGANIGAVIPSILTAIGGSPTAKRVAFINAFMKVSGALLFMGLSYALMNPLCASPSWAIDPKLQVALSHLIFNLTCAVIFLPLLKPLCRFGEIVFKEKQVGEKIEFTELDPKVIKTFPSTGISLAGSLSLKMFHYAGKMFEMLKKYLDEPDDDKKEYILELERAIDNIDRHLSDFLIKAEVPQLNYSDSLAYNRMLRAIKDIERIGDYGENLLNFFSNMNDKKESLDEDQKKEIYSANDIALSLINKTFTAYKDGDKKLALDIIKERREHIKTLESYQEAYFVRETKKKASLEDRSDYLALIYVDILNSYERVCAHCSNIAKLFNSDKDLSSYSKTDEHQFAKMSSRY